MNQNKVIETEIWEPVPEKPYQVRFVKTRTVYEVFKELEAAMKANDMMPDEYFSLSYRLDEKSAIPRDARFFAYAQWGGNEGVYLEVEMVSECGMQHFATGKTLGETEEDYDRMQAIAGFIYKSFAGFGRVNSTPKAIEQMYAVCIDESYIRDAQYFNPEELSDDEMSEMDIHGIDGDSYWECICPNAFIGIVSATSEEEAVRRASEEYGYDQRVLYAVRVADKPKRKEALYDAMLNHISELVSGSDLVDTLHAIGFTDEEIAEEGFSTEN